MRVEARHAGPIPPLDLNENGAGAVQGDAASRDGVLPGIEVLGYRFHPLRKRELLARLFEPRPEGARMVIAGANLHGLYMAETVAEYRALLDRPSTLVIVDGMPVIWLLKLLGHSVGAAHRTTWADWFEDALAEAAARRRRVYILGHRQAVLDRGLLKARDLWPTLEISGANGFFDIDDKVSCLRVVEAINRAAPDILIVGMGMPRQEIFIERYASTIQAPVIGLGGAAFAYFVGDQATPPRWMGQAGLEWLYRLGSDPRRMAGRYLVEPAFLLGRLGLRLLRRSQ